MVTIEPRDIAWVIKSHDRSPSHNYLPDTIAALKHSTPHQRDVPVHVVINDHLSLQQNAMTAIKVGVETGLPYVVVMEDDLDFCRDFQGSVARWLSDHISSDYLMYVFGANYEQINRAVQRGQTCWKYPVGAFYGAQALAWTNVAAGDLVAFLGDDPAYNGVKNHGHDLLIQQWAKGLGAEHFLASAPSMVQHVGEQSGIGNRFFRFASWPGREWSYGGNGNGRT